MDDKQGAYIKSQVNKYAVKFLADNKRSTIVTDERLEDTYRDCVVPPNHSLYLSIKIRIEEMRKDPNYKFDDDK
ncbi:hypothetical protein [Paenibacillus taichungensis]|uniref:hypothetical protein n=1 Tax=Paenibacillus taichungensis TaxID=484184 RepID=UPI0039A21CBF